MISYWEQFSFTKYRYVVIGSGIVGLSTALSLKEHDPEASVLILERGVFPTGASTKNAGFACFGSLTELLADIQAIGEKATQELVADRWKGLQLLRKRVGDKHLDFQNYGGYELLFDQGMETLQSMDSVNRLLEPVLGRKVFSLRSDLIETFGFNRNRLKGLIENPLEGQIHTGQTMKRLIDLAREQRIDILTGAEVLDLQPHAKGVEVMVSSLYPDPIKFRAKRVAVCTNAFSKRLLPELDIDPARGLVLITKPLKGLKFKGIFHYLQGYYYFRNLGSRVLLGGARNLDLHGEKTLEFGSNEIIFQHLKKELSDLILPGIAVDIQQTWSGIMAFGPDKRPLLGLRSPEIGYAVRLGGMGVALGSLLGDRLARLLCLNG